MLENAINLDLYSFLEPFSPILDGEEFTQQQVDAFKVILINFSMQNNFREAILNQSAFIFRMELGTRIKVL